MAKPIEGAWQRPAGVRAQAKEWTDEERLRLEQRLIEGIPLRDLTHEFQVTQSQLHHQIVLGGGVLHYCPDVAAGKSGVNPAIAREWSKPKICRHVLKFLDRLERRGLDPADHLSFKGLRSMLESVLETTGKKDGLVNRVSIKERRLIYDMVKQGYDTTAICVHIGKNFQQTKEYVRRYYAQQRKLSSEEIGTRIAERYVTNSDISDV